MIVDLFAGPGGWDEGLRALGRTDVIGIEHDASACLTRHAAGHLTIRADVSTYPTAPFVGKTEGLIASPPCPTFSVAGKGEGVDEMPMLHSFADRFAKTGWFDPWTHHAWSDPRTPLVLEPLRWAADLRPEWITLEQVPALEELWAHYADIWRAAGYACWSGVLNAANYGVPQTRKRAFCMANRTRPVQPPVATHARRPTPSLLGELQPWVTMADALGWGASSGPCVTVTGGGTATGGAEPIAHVARFRERERVMVATRGDSGRDRDEFDAMSQPSRTLTGKTDSWVVDRRTNSKAAGGGMTPTVPVPMSEPAPTLTSKAGGQWVFHRMGDPRLAAPGYRGGHDDRSTTMMADAIRITIEEALILQSFRPDYPVQGTKTKKFEQVGNANPPLLAQAVLGAVGVKPPAAPSDDNGTPDV